MAKGKDMSKKQKGAAKEKMVVDKTFGMKNKNKSKKVQKYVQQVAHAAQNKFVDRKEEKAKKDAMSRKEAKKQHDAEIAALFQVVEDKKPKKKPKEEAAPAEAEETIDDTAAFLAELGIETPQADGRRKLARQRRDAEANAKEETRLRKLAERDGKSIEERLEVVRKGLQLDAPVNKDTFLEWKAERDVRRREEKEAAVAKAKKQTKRGGKSQLTGRQLFEFHQDLFVDDAEAGGSEQYTREFEDAQQAQAAAAGEEIPAAAEGAIAEGANAEQGAGGMPDPNTEEQQDPGLVPPSNSSAAAPSLEGIDESVFLAENLEDLDDLPSDDDE